MKNVNALTVRNLDNADSDYFGKWTRTETEKEMAEFVSGRAFDENEWIDFVFCHLFEKADLDVVQFMVERPEIETARVRTSQGLVEIARS